MSASRITPPGGTAPVEQPATGAVRQPTPERTHYVVVTTRAVRVEDQAPPGALLLTRFWHPRDRRWSENTFESLDHAIRLFVDETGWSLIQQQRLGSEHEHELIFQARPEDFQGPSTEEILKEAGLTPSDVEDLLDSE